MAIITTADLPVAIQAHELVDTMVAGANARASRVAPCLVEPTTTAWAATTDYAVGDQVKLATDEFIEVTTAGTSGASVPTVPSSIGGTVEDGTVTWERIAPHPDQIAEAKLVLIGAVKRWTDAGAGALQSEGIGSYNYTVDTRQRTGYNLWPSEINALQDICAAGTDNSASAFSITPSRSTSAHIAWCALNFGATYCSCGADIAGYPIYEAG